MQVTTIKIAFTHRELPGENRYGIVELVMSRLMDDWEAYQGASPDIIAITVVDVEEVS